MNKQLLAFGLACEHCGKTPTMNEMEDGVTVCCSAKVINDEDFV